MRKYLIPIAVVLILVPLMFILSACNSSSGDNNDQAADTSTMTAEQSAAYQEVVTYSKGTDCSSEDLASALTTVRKDIVSNTDFENEITIGKYRIDRLKLDSEYEVKKIRAKGDSDTNKQNYLLQMNLCTNRYLGTQAQYNAEVNSLNQQSTQAYVTYQNKVNGISPNLGSNYKEHLRQQYYQEYQQTEQSISNQKSSLQTQWNNKVKYDSYSAKYNTADADLQVVLNNLQTEYDQAVKTLNQKMNECIAKR